MKNKITVIGIGPGHEGDMTARAMEALRCADIVVGYNYYVPFISHLLRPDAEIVKTGMKQERARIEKAVEIAAGGRDVCVISSGDSGIYGMAPLVYEMLRERGIDAVVEVVPGISAFQKAASLLGAPVGHDFCVISLSDLMTPWTLIEKRIRAAVDADFVTAVYNPKSTPCTEIPSDKKRNQTANNIALVIQAIKKQTMGGPPLLLRISGLLLYCELLLKNICYPIC